MKKNKRVPRVIGSSFLYSCKGRKEKCIMSDKLQVGVYETKEAQGISVEIEKGQTILESLQQTSLHFSAFCGGSGLCGKCKIRLLEGTLPISQEDRKFFLPTELEQGYRLSCKAVPTDDCKILLQMNRENDFSVVSAYEENGEGIQKQNKNEIEDDKEFVIAIDIGTTTLAFQLIGKNTRNVIRTYTALNHQRDFGADVISRIKASNEGKKEQLCKSIRSDLRKGIRELLKENVPAKESVRKIAIGANTTMGHLLMNYSCESLGVYPFNPVNISKIKTDCKTLLDIEDMQADIILLPGISTFVGGDISAGLLKFGFDSSEKLCVLIDLGTNGEMAIGNKDRILCTSTAAGPAFEGGNISCGVGSIQGAISNVSLTERGAQITTIGNEPPVGICGTGVVEIVSELVRMGFVDETGLLVEEYFEEGYPLGVDLHGKKIAFTQKDIREIQLAKSAVRAGIEVLLKRFEADYEQIDTVYLAGGFGYKIDVEKAILIGLIPKEFAGKIQAVGNSSLAGAVEYLLNADSEKRLEKIITNSTEINLSTDKDFNQLYMDFMMFG